jgi:hypothetical protein
MEKQRMRVSLIKDIEAELNKEAEDLDGDFIDRRIDELYAAEGLSPPKLSREALDAAARTVRSRAAWRSRNKLAEGMQKRRFTRRLLRGTLAACGVFLVLFSLNYLSALATGSCIPSKAGLKFCCGTRYCACDIAQAEEENPSHTE